MSKEYMECPVCKCEKAVVVYDVIHTKSNGDMPFIYLDCPDCENKIELYEEQ